MAQVTVTPEGPLRQLKWSIKRNAHIWSDCWGRSKTPNQWEKWQGCTVNIVYRIRSPSPWAGRCWNLLKPLKATTSQHDCSCLDNYDLDERESPETHAQVQVAYTALWFMINHVMEPGQGSAMSLCWVGPLTGGWWPNQPESRRIKSEFTWLNFAPKGQGWRPDCKMLNAKWSHW